MFYRVVYAQHCVFTQPGVLATSIHIRTAPHINSPGQACCTNLYLPVLNSRPHDLLQYLSRSHLAGLVDHGVTNPSEPFNVNAVVQEGGLEPGTEVRGI